MSIRAIVLALVWSVSSMADVTDSSATGFTSVNTAVIAGSPDLIYDRLTQEVSSWWDPAHTWFGDTSGLSIDARAGGTFKEEIRGKGSALHMDVVYAERGQLLRMRGGLGPLQGLAVTGSLTWSLKDANDSTEITLTYTVTGYVAGGLAGFSKPVDVVLQHQLQRLTRYTETGKP